jgi:hypothetical protein
LATLASALSACKLITEGDEGYANKAAMLGYLQGRSIDHDTIYRGVSYLQGKGTNLYWKQTPSQNQPSRGHNAVRPPTAQDMRFAPKEETNLPGGQGRYNYAADERFNGAKERRERLEQERRAGVTDSDVQVMESTRAMEYYWQGEIDKLIASGVTHSERNLIAKIAQQAPGSARQRHTAVKAEADRIRRARELVRS